MRKALLPIAAVLAIFAGWPAALAQGPFDAARDDAQGRPAGFDPELFREMRAR